MIGRKKYSLLVTGFLAVLFIASLTTTAYAYELEEGPVLPTSGSISSKPALEGERIRQASLNWADYAEEPAIVTAPQQVWEGEKISQASLNWADYAKEPALAQITD